MEFQNKVAVITGAGSGIGRALAQLLDQKGCRLSISDINEKSLAETAALLSRPPHQQKLDVADRVAVYAYADAVKQEFGSAHFVFNNAGVAVAQTVEKLDYADFEWIMGINFWGVVYGTKAFLPMLLAQREGYIVNVSSIFGIIAVPTQGSYNAAKFAVRGFTEALRHELDGSGVKAICVHPGGIKTNIAATSRFYVGFDGNTDARRAAKDFARLAKTTPEQAAQVIVSAMEKGKQRVLIGSDAKMLDAIQRALPENYWKSIAKLLRKLR